MPYLYFCTSKARKLHVPSRRLRQVHAVAVEDIDERLRGGLEQRRGRAVEAAAVIHHPETVGESLQEQRPFPEHCVFKVSVFVLLHW